VIGMEIHLNTGATVHVDATECASTKDNETQRITKLEWVTPKGGRRDLHRIDLDAIVCIVVIHGE
jgi:hypothetical protein